MAVTAAHIVESGSPHIYVLTSEQLELLNPHEFAQRAVPAKTVTLFAEADMALLEFEDSFRIPTPSNLVVTKPGSSRKLTVRIKGYPSRLAKVNARQSSYVPMFAEATVIVDQIHGGFAGTFALDLGLLKSANDYKGMSGAVLTYVDEPLAVQREAWQGAPAMVAFRRIDRLREFAESEPILQAHGIGTIEIQHQFEHLFLVGDEEYDTLPALPVPIIGVPNDLIDIVRTRDFTA